MTYPVRCGNLRHGMVSAVNRDVSDLREVMKDTREAAQIGDWHTALSKKVLRRASRSRFGVIIRTVFPKRGYAPSCSRMSSTTRNTTLRRGAAEGGAGAGAARTFRANCHLGAGSVITVVAPASVCSWQRPSLAGLVAVWCEYPKQAARAEHPLAHAAPSAAKASPREPWPFHSTPLVSASGSVYSVPAHGLARLSGRPRMPSSRQSQGAATRDCGSGRAVPARTCRRSAAPAIKGSLAVRVQRRALD